MSALLLRLAGDVTVRGTTTHDGMQVFSRFVNLVCQKSDSYSRQVWMRLISKDSKFKDEIEFKMHFFEYQFGTQEKMRTRQTPVMTLRGLQRLFMILDNKVATDFRQILQGTFTRFMAGGRP
jgi:hypothetical protein